LTTPSSLEQDLWKADLRHAKFRSLDESLSDTGEVDNDRALGGRTAYLDHIAAALDLNPVVNFKMPNFSCANLAEADFDHHTLFPGVIELRTLTPAGGNTQWQVTCNGSGFLKVTQPANPGHRIYPPRCTKCGGRGRVQRPNSKMISRKGHQVSRRSSSGSQR
jgi:hypothetical protein